MKNEANTVTVKIMGLAALLTALFMTCFEMTKQLIHSGITVWQSHVATIIFTTAVSALLTLFALKKHRTLLRILAGLIPMCAWCRRIQDENGKWVSMETYIESHTLRGITHGICTECAAKVIQPTKTAH